MKYAWLALVFVFGTAQADSAYTVKKGINWKGVKIGNSAPSGSDFICRYQECYPLVVIGVSNQFKQRYNFDTLNFKGLSTVATARTEKRITLEEELGQVLFRRSRAEIQRQKFSDSK